MKKIITIFGSTGNLMYKKLLPALHTLIKNKFLTKETKIYIIARKDWSLQDYIRDALTQITSKIDFEIIEPYLTYIKMDVDKLDDYKNLKATIDQEGDNLDKMFYLAVPPQLFPVIAKGISESGLIKKGEKNARIVFEKPFGEDLKTAKEINTKLWQYFDEPQIYRIDHYLGKEMIQNVLVVRFANIIFENNWDNKSIENIIIIAKEKESILNRGNYYDKVGALKDMVQSHLMQMVALITMEKPDQFTSSNIKDEKVKAIKKLKIDKNHLILGQYEGYRKVKNVDPNSNTETFVYAKAYIDNERWKNVPIHLLTGKHLNEKRSEIIINFKNNDTHFKNSTHNKLIIKVAPIEGVNFIFNVKEAGLNEQIVPAVLDYCHSCEALGNTPEAYEKLLLDLSNQQNSLFTRWDEIENSWKIIDELKLHNLKPLIYQNYDELKQEILKISEDLKNDL